MPRLLLTGAQGFTGRHFAAAAATRGHEVVALAADLTDARAVAAEVARIEPSLVVHLAAISAVTHENDEEMYRVNLLGTMHLLQALTASPGIAQRVLLASSANVYGNTTQSPIGESSPVGPVNHYAVSKLAMEFMARTFLDRLPIVLVRPFNYTGPGHDERFLVPKLVAHFVRRAPSIELGNLDVEREFNDVRMVCDAYLALLERGVPGEVYNVCSGRPLSLRHVVAAFERLTGHAISVSVHPGLVRANEVRTLCGSPAKLVGCIGALRPQPLDGLLEWMLDCASVAASASPS